MSGLPYLDMSQNCIEGEFPSDIGELKAIIKLDFSSNHFSGKLPSKLGELQKFQYLDLSNNSFFGQFPLSFCQIDKLGILGFVVKCFVRYYSQVNGKTLIP